MDRAGPPPRPPPAAARCGRMWRRAADAGAVPRGSALPCPGAQAPAAGAGLTRANKVGRRLPSLPAPTRLTRAGGPQGPGRLAESQRASARRTHVARRGTPLQRLPTPALPPRVAPALSGRGRWPDRGLGRGWSPCHNSQRGASPSPPKGASLMWRLDPVLVLPWFLDAERRMGRQEAAVGQELLRFSIPPANTHEPCYLPGRQVLGATG